MSMDDSSRKKSIAAPSYYRVSAHGCSQLKRQNLRVGGYTENVLKWFNYPHARAHPGCEVSCRIDLHRRSLVPGVEEERLVHTDALPVN